MKRPCGRAKRLTPFLLDTDTSGAKNAFDVPALLLQVNARASGRAAAQETGNEHALKNSTSLSENKRKPHWTKLERKIS